MFTGRLGSRLLTLILVFLILSSMVQMTVIWGEELRGFPFNLFSGDRTRQDGQLSLGNVFKPSGIHISKGIDQPKYELSGGGYETAWNDAGRYLKQIFNDEKISNASNYAYTLNEWRRIVTKKGFLITFPFDLEPEFLRCFLGCASDFSEIVGGIRAVAVLPWDNVNPNMLNIFIRTAYDIYRFTLEIPDLNERRLIYDILLDDAEASGKQGYSFLSEVFPMEAFDFDINGTMLIPDGEDVTTDDLAVVAVNALNLQSTYTDEGYVNEVAARISNNNEINYLASINSENTVTLKNVNNTYRYYIEGVLEYNYISGTSAKPEANINTMLANVSAQLSSFSSFLDLDKIYLSGIRRQRDQYVFAFDYMHGADAIILDMAYRNGKAENLVEITSNGLTVTGYRVVPLALAPGNGSRVRRIDFVSLLDNLYPSLPEYTEFSFKAYQSAYSIKGFSAIRQIYPVWHLVSFNNNRYFVDKAE